MSILLSIIVPCYNASFYIINLLDQIASQLDDETELILINDGSTDDTLKLMLTYKESSINCRRIIVKDTVNQGAAKARQVGLRCALGKFVFFCDSDDSISLDFIAIFKHYYRIFPKLELLYFSSDIAIQKSKELVRQSYKVKYDCLESFTDGIELLQHNLENGMYTSAVWTYIFKRSLIEEIGADFTHRKVHEDHLFTLKIVVASVSVIAIPELMYTQRIREGSLTNSNKDICYLIDRITAANEAESFLFMMRAAIFRKYRKWNFLGILTILKENQNLIRFLLKEKIVWYYFGLRIDLAFSLILLKIKNRFFRTFTLML